MDRPFAGALVPAEHYRRDPQVLALMIEVNRALYMDEDSAERSDGFERVRRFLADCLDALDRAAAPYAHR